ncbi:WEB family [Dillenia turbinata]|uniref:WEB family n=1 Tax=Dillenia turbinata TaxID=194707 RepID=A0AAN8Z3A1_9MAGN
MESFEEVSVDTHLKKARELKEKGVNTMEVKMAELINTREELKRAKESAMQSWLDSRPLIDELEKLKSGLESAKNRSSMSRTVISELESQLEAIDKQIKLAKEEEQEARRITDEISHAMYQTHEEMENLKHETDEERRARAELKQILRLRRQTLRTLQLTLRAIRTESEAYGASATEALHYMNHSKLDKNTIQISQQEYHALIRKATEEKALAQWRASVSMEQKLVAESSRDSALRRLKELHMHKRPLRKGIIKCDVIRQQDGIKQTEPQNSSVWMKKREFDNKQFSLPRVRMNSLAKSDRQWSILIQQLRASWVNQAAQIGTRNVAGLLGLCHHSLKEKSKEENRIHRKSIPCECLNAIETSLSTPSSLGSVYL